MEEPGSLIFKGPSNYSSADVLLLETLTHLHVGSGKVAGFVDLPVQRDEYGFPCIYSSSLKGALKTALLHSAIKASGGKEDIARDLVMSLMGSEPDLEESFESSVALLDAYLLAIPARSLKGVYTYVTTPILLRKFKEYLDLTLSVRETGSSEPADVRNAVEKILNIAETLREDEYICLEGKDGLCRGVQIEELGKKVVLVEDVILSGHEVDGHEAGTKLKEDGVNLSGFLSGVETVERPLLVLGDSTGKEVIERSLLVLAHVRLGESKTVEEGPWSAEYVPAKTKFFSVALFKRPWISDGMLKRYLRNDKVQRTKENYEKVLKELGFEGFQDGNFAQAARQKFRDLVKMNRNYVIVGGRETVGKGIMRIKFL
ncbi:MAG: type III-B CRISPR module RAMP protein Cmr4 [Thermofilum sp.]|jgi:CRISPR-associated protein Cmr4|nr:type III-B CRISPR module RAMP protein Cmr4 [Thermofilum sp.]